MNKIPNYRVWHKIEKRFVDLRSIDFELDNIGYDAYREANYYDVAKFDEIVFQQFTGYTTIDGIEVYEGDLVSYEYEDKCVVHEVMWAWGAWHLGISKDFHNYSSRNINRLGTAYYKCKIIGNIFENSELLNK